MNFDLSETEKALCGKIKGLFDPQGTDALLQLEKGEADQVREKALNWSKPLGETGYLALGLDDAKNHVGLVAAQESLAALSPSLFLTVEVTTRIFGRLVAVYGTDRQKAELLQPLKEGAVIGAVALSEGGMNIENTPLATTGVSGNDGLLVSGSKGHVVNAPIADWIAVAGMVEEREAFFLVKRGSEGLSIGERFCTLGHKGAAISSLSLENCHVASNRVMGPFEGAGPLKTVRMWEDQVLAAASLGVMKRSFEAALDYAKKHNSGGKPIIAYQEVGFKLAEMLTLWQTSQLLAYRAAWMSETQDREAGVLAHCAKVFCAESAEEVASNALKILGGLGYLQGNPAEEGYRDAKYLQIAGTSTEISRIKIGDQVLERE